MVLGTLLVAQGSFSSLVTVSVGPLSTQVYAAVVALTVNLLVALTLTPVLDRCGVGRGIDATAVSEPGRADPSGAVAR
jgi:SSS family solute:Na+ symporter